MASTGDSGVNVPMSGEPGDEPTTELEIEKKFPIPDLSAAIKMEQTLESLGFVSTKSVEFVDWYFDLPGPNWHFSLRDFWIRYREKKVKMDEQWGWRGAWQVKRGKSNTSSIEGGRENDGMTVYEEMQGEPAIRIILEELSNLDLENERKQLKEDSQRPDDSSLNFNRYNIPSFPGGEKLVPFARFETRRTGWQIPTPDISNDSASSNISSPFSGLKVDIDKTDFGYMVGEVEAVVQNDDVGSKTSGTKTVVEAEKEKIRSLVATLTENNCKQASDSSLPLSVGKLEYYMINNRRDHYNACVEAGIMSN